MLTFIATDLHCCIGLHDIQDYASLIFLGHDVYLV